ncbi:MAG: hypothetical protein RIQ76_965, partial [Pseudomonadota bacterium]
LNLYFYICSVYGNAEEQPADVQKWGAAMHPFLLTRNL